LRDAAQHAADDEHADAGEQERFAAVQVGQLSHDRYGDRRRQEVNRGDRRVLLEPVQLGHDPRHGGSDDRRVEGRHEHGDDDPRHARDDDMAGKLRFVHLRRRPSHIQPSAGRSMRLR
jgi:hypothetical protein